MPKYRNVKWHLRIQRLADVEQSISKLSSPVSDSGLLEMPFEFTNHSSISCFCISHPIPSSPRLTFLPNSLASVSHQSYPVILHRKKVTPELNLRALRNAKGFNKSFRGTLSL